MRFSNTSIAALLMASVVCVDARADIFIGDFASSSGIPPPAARRYRESDAGLVCTALNVGETMQGITLGSNGVLYTCFNDIGFGAIRRHDALTGAALPDLVPDGQPEYRIPNGLALIGNSVFSTSQVFNGGGMTGVIRFDATTGAFLGIPIGPGDHGLGIPRNVYRMPNNDLLVTDDSRINRYNADTGAFISTFIANAAGFGQSTFGPDGHFYVCASGGIERYDGTSGAFLGTFISAVPARSCTFGNDGLCMH